MDAVVRCVGAGLGWCHSGYAGPPHSRAAQGGSAVSSDPVECRDVYNKFLPGEFDFCLALRDQEKGRYNQMVEMLMLAAGWGQKRAQYTLGIMYFNGQHVRANRPLGLAWLVLAAERHDMTATIAAGSAFRASTAAERRQADVLLARLRQHYGDAVAAPRAMNRFNRFYREVFLASFDGSTSLCISGLDVMAPLPNEIDTGPSMSSCPPISQTLVKLREIGNSYFAGWEGQVSVGDPEQLPATSGSVP